MRRWGEALRRGVPGALAPTGTFLLAFALRCLGHPTVFTHEGLVPFGNDAYYHLRRVAFTLERWPESLPFDRYLRFPDGAMAIWPSFFDSAVASLLLPIHWLAGLDVALAAAVFVPPLLGALCVLVLHLFARRLFGEPAATLAATVLALLSGHQWYSQLGFLDHHAAVALLSTGQLALCASLIETLRSAGPGSGRRAALLGVLCGCALWLWPGALLYVGLCVAGLAAFVLVASAARFGRALEAWCLLGASGAVVSVFASSGPRWPQFGAFSPVVISHFQPWLFTVLLVQGGATLMWWRRTGRHAPARGRALVFGGLGLGVLVLSLLLAPGLAAGARDAWQWGARDEAFQRLVAESLPLLRVGERLSTQVLELRLSRFAYLVVPALVWLTMRARTHSQRGALSFIVFWCSALIVMTLLQRRFFDSLAVVQALVIGWALARSRALIARWIVERRGSTALAALASWACVVGLSLVALAPSLAASRAPAANLLRYYRGEPLELSAAPSASRAMVRAARWLRANSAQTRGWLDARVQPEYGVWTGWDVGHLVRWEARRPVLVDNFGDDLGTESFARARRYLTLGEDEGAGLLADLRARYVVVRRGPGGETGPPGSLGAQLTRPRPPGFRRHRMLFEGPGSVTVRSMDRLIRIYEVVPGARVVGHAAPGETVRARLAYRTQLGRRGSYEVMSRANALGRFELTLAQPSRGGPSDFETEGSYQLESAARRARLVVSEVDVVEGRVLSAPDWSASP